MYHYAGNNPVKYVDPDGNFVENCSNQYIVVRTEKAGYVIIAPFKNYDGKNVTGLDGQIISNIDNGKIDGVIFSDGKIQKFTDDSRNPFNVNVRILPNMDDLCAIPLSIRDALLNSVGDVFKFIFSGRNDFSGPDFIGSGTGAGEWLSESPSQEILKNIIGDYDCLFINHENEKILEGMNNESQ